MSAMCCIEGVMGSEKLPKLSPMSSFSFEYMDPFPLDLFDSVRLEMDDRWRPRENRGPEALLGSRL